MMLDKTDILIKPIVGKSNNIRVLDNVNKVYSTMTNDRNSYTSGIDENGMIYLVQPNDVATITLKGDTYFILTGKLPLTNSILYPYTLSNNWWAKHGLTLDENQKAPFTHNEERIDCGTKLIPSSVSEEHYITASFPGKNKITLNNQLMLQFNVTSSEEFNIRIETDLTDKNGNIHTSYKNISIGEAEIPELPFYYTSVHKLAYNYYRIGPSFYDWSGITHCTVRIYITDKNFNKTFVGNGNGVTFAGIEWVDGSLIYMPISFPTFSEGTIISRLYDTTKFEHSLIKNMLFGEYEIYFELNTMNLAKVGIGWTPTMLYFGNSSSNTSFRINFSYAMSWGNSFYVFVSLLNSSPGNIYFNQYTEDKVRIVLKVDNGNAKFFANDNVLEFTYTPRALSDSNLYLGVNETFYRTLVRNIRIMHGLTDDECQTLAKKGFIHD